MPLDEFVGGGLPKMRLKIIICGAGLGGLGAAIALARKGHDVIVVESAKGLSEVRLPLIYFRGFRRLTKFQVGAGIQIPPNSSRILYQYGLGEKFLEKVVWPQHFAFRRYATGELLGTTPLNPHLTQKYGYPYWLIHRADFQRLLYDAAISQGAKVFLGSPVASVDTSVPSVTLVTGETLKADVVVGADGIRSKTRAAILLDGNPSPNASSNCSYRATVPVEAMSADPEVSHLMTDINANCWIGPDHHIMAYPIRNGAMYNLVLSHLAGNAAAGMWNEPGNLEEMLDRYRSFDPMIKKVLTKVTSCLNWKIADLPRLPTWLSKSGSVVLIGDAAHAMVPFLAQGAAQSIEDGACLAECLDRVTSRSQISTYLHAFESIRKPRTERVQQATRDSSGVWHLPDGPEQEARDLAFKNMASDARDEVADEALAKANPNSLSSKEFQPWLFGHDVFEATNSLLDGMSSQHNRRSNM